MALTISQETFNKAIQENIDDLGLSPEEALEEAVTQFQSQGVDLSSIVKELKISTSDMDKINDDVKKLIDLNKNNASSAEIISQLDVIKEECDKGVQNRVAAGKAGAYNAILDTIDSKSKTYNVEIACLRTIIALMSNQPDLFNDRGLVIILSYLKKEVDFDIKKLALRWTKECCVMHEMNRQKIFNAHILDNLKELLNDGTSDILREILSVFRCLVLDDDVRVEFGTAHEHARIIANETLCSLTGLLARFKTDEPLINDLMLTLCALMVRTEFCKKVEDAGCLELIKEVMQTFYKNEKINRQCFKFIKSLAGNDDCKIHMIKKELAPVIITAVDNSKGNVQTATAGLSSIAALTLRCPDNSQAFFEVGAPKVIVQIMELHQASKPVQKAASWAIRNMVSRSRDQTTTFLELGVENILKENLKKFKDIEYDTKAALRDLGCKVQLKEEWTGRGGALTTEMTKK